MLSDVTDIVQFPRLCLVLLCVLLIGCEEEKQPVEIIRPVRAMKVANFAGVTDRSFPGRAVATRETDLAFEVGGRLVQRPVFVGDRVEAGTVLAKVDPRDFENDVSFAKAGRDRARAHFERIERAAKTGAVAQQDLTDAEARWKMAAAELRVAQKALEDTVLIAPFAGTVSRTFRENFDNVRAKEPVIRLVDTSRVEFVIDIPEGLISMILYMQPIRVRFDAFPAVEVPAQVKEIGTEASDTTRTYPVTLIMDQPEGALVLPGMVGTATGSASPPSEGQRTNIVVPVTAVFASKQNNESSVWVIDESSNTVNRRTVQIGNLRSGGYVINAGLEPGEIIATAGAHYLSEGQKVRPEVR